MNFQNKLITLALTILLIPSLHPKALEPISVKTDHESIVATLQPYTEEEAQALFERTGGWNQLPEDAYFLDNEIGQMSIKNKIYSNECLTANLPCRYLPLTLKIKNNSNNDISILKPSSERFKKNDLLKEECIFVINNESISFKKSDLKRYIKTAINNNLINSNSMADFLNLILLIFENKQIDKNPLTIENVLFTSKSEILARYNDLFKIENEDDKDLGIIGNLIFKALYRKETLYLCCAGGIIGTSISLVKNDNINPSINRYIEKINDNVPHLKPLSTGIGLLSIAGIALERYLNKETVQKQIIKKKLEKQFNLIDGKQTRQNNKNIITIPAGSTYTDILFINRSWFPTIDQYISSPEAVPKLTYEMKP